MSFVTNGMLCKARVVHVPLRFIDPGKWSDCPWFIEKVNGNGLVVNVCGFLRPWGGSGDFRGAEVIYLPDDTRDGRVIVSADADSKFDAGADVCDLATGRFDHRDITLATLSKVDFSSLKRGSIRLVITSGIGPGASLGTSASVMVALLRTLCGSEVDSYNLAMAAVGAEINIAQKPAGNQDPLSASFGSSLNPATALRIEIGSDFPEATVAPIAIGERIRRAVNDGGVITFLGPHDSSAEHALARQRIELTTKEIALGAFTSLVASAEVAEQALKSDDPTALGNALNQATEAHRMVHPKLIGAGATRVIRCAKRSGSLGTMLPGAGGAGGCVFSLFPSRAEADAFVQESRCDQHYEVRLAG